MYGSRGAQLGLLGAPPPSCPAARVLQLLRLTDNWKDVTIFEEYLTPIIICQCKRCIQISRRDKIHLVQSVLSVGKYSGRLCWMSRSKSEREQRISKYRSQFERIFDRGVDEKNTTTTGGP